MLEPEKVNSISYTCSKHGFLLLEGNMRRSVHREWKISASLLIILTQKERYTFSCLVSLYALVLFL